jgi:hypothetical protein
MLVESTSLPYSLIFQTTSRTPCTTFYAQYSLSSSLDIHATGPCCFRTGGREEFPRIGILLRSGFGDTVSHRHRIFASPQEAHLWLRSPSWSPPGFFISRAGRDEESKGEGPPDGHAGTPLLFMKRKPWIPRPEARGGKGYIVF